MVAGSTIANADEKLVDLVRKVKPSVVLIETFDKNNKPIGQGSGFFIDNKGSLITNHHVIEGAYSATIKTSAGKEYPVQGIVAKDIEADIAKLIVNLPDANIIFLNLSVNVPSEGEDIVVIGNPLGLESTVSTGIVSAVRDIPAFGKILQITAPISPGSSGSPVINSKGEVIGIATLVVTEGQNLNFAIPSDKIIALKETPKTTIFESYNAMTADANDAQSFYDKGLKELWQENWSAALVYFKKVIAENPQEADAWFYNGYCYSKLGRYQEAILAYKQAIQIKPDDADAYNNLGNACLQLGHYQDTIETCKQALRIKSDYAEAHLNIGLAYCQLGRYEDAIEACEQAVRIKPDYVAAHSGLGLTYLLVGDKNTALQEYKILKNLDVESANQLFNLISSSDTNEIGDKPLSENASSSGMREPLLYHNSEGHFSLTIPAGWEEIPRDAIKATLKLLQEQNASSSELNRQNYDGAFQKTSTTYFTYPYVLFAIDEKGRWPEREIEKFASSDEWEKDAQKGLRTVEKQLSNLIQNIKLGQTTYDKRRNILFIKVESEVVGIGKVIGITSIIPSNYGAVNLHCYSTKDNFENDLPAFTQIIDSFRYDIGYEYNQFTKNKSSDTASGSLFGVGLIVFICVGLATLVIIIVARKSSGKSSNFPDGKQYKYDTKTITGPNSISTQRAILQTTDGRNETGTNKIESCQNCGRKIGKLEKTFSFNGNQVCYECSKRLKDLT